MGKITSASTIYANAYLTERGRQYLFNQGNVRYDSNGNDLLQVISFTLSDCDTNYNITERLVSGDIPDITGKSDNCIKATADYTQTNLLYQQVDVLLLADPLYLTNAPDNILFLDVDNTTVFPASQASDVPPTVITVLNGNINIPNING